MKKGSVVLKVFALIIVALVVTLFVYNVSHKPEVSRDVWNVAMTKGDPDNENYFVEYTDMFCPYCANFNRAMGANFDRDYIETDKVFFEMRLTALIADHSENSQRGNETAYCAARQEKFWTYYDAVLEKLYEDYHSKGIGVSKVSPQIPKLDDSYYFDVASFVGLDVENMKKCLSDGDALKELATNTEKAARTLPSGVPHIVVNDYTSSGFDGDYSTIKMILKAGGVE
jgi:Protein-disulfide isomerase